MGLIRLEKGDQTIGRGIEEGPVRLRPFSYWKESDSPPNTMTIITKMIIDRSYAELRVLTRSSALTTWRLL